MYHLRISFTYLVIHLRDLVVIDCLPIHVSQKNESITKQKLLRIKKRWDDLLAIPVWKLYLRLSLKETPMDSLNCSIHVILLHDEIVSNIRCTCREHLYIHARFGYC